MAKPKLLVTRRLPPAVTDRVNATYDAVTNDDDHIMSPVVGSRWQNAGAQLVDWPAAPRVAQSAPIRTTGIAGAPPDGGGAALVVGFATGCCRWPFMRNKAAARPPIKINPRAITGMRTDARIRGLDRAVGLALGRR